QSAGPMHSIRVWKPPGTCSVVHLSFMGSPMTHVAIIWPWSQQQAPMLLRGHISASQGMVGPPPLELELTALLELATLVELAALLELASPLLELASPLLVLPEDAWSPPPLVEPTLLLVVAPPVPCVPPLLKRPPASPTPPQPNANAKRPANVPSEIQ